MERSDQERPGRRGRYDRNRTPDHAGTHRYYRLLRAVSRDRHIYPSGCQGWSYFADRLPRSVNRAARARAEAGNIVD